MKCRILLIHGPNLNLLGQREPALYGHKSSVEIVASLRTDYSGIELEYFQSNSEAELIDKIQKSRNSFDGILINAGGLSHHSVSLADAIRASGLPAIGLHITNIFVRESYRQKDVVGEACAGLIAGLGTAGYPLALECLIDVIEVSRRPAGRKRKA